MSMSQGTTSVRAEIRRRTSDKDLIEVLVAAVDAGAMVKFTRKGVMLALNGETTLAHWTQSDRRSLLNLAADLRRIGVPIPHGTASKAKHTKGRRPERSRRSSVMPAPWEAPRDETLSFTRPLVPMQVEPAQVEPAEQPKPKRPNPRAQAGVTARKVPAWYALIFPHLPDSLRTVELDLMEGALACADGDPRRITADNGTLTIWNKAVW